MHLQTVLILLFSKALAQDMPLPTCYRDSRLSRAHRLEGIKQEILQRLGLDHEPCNPANATDVIDPDFLREYASVKKSWELSDMPKPPCASLDFDTLEVVPFRPVSVEKKKRLIRTADHVECPSDLSVEFYNIYTINFDIDLRGYHYFTDAQLRLRKSRLNTNVNHRTMNDTITEDQIDVKFLIAAENYYGEIYKRFITSKRLRSDSISEMVVFNVTKAIEWWLDFNENQTNKITFELHIRCSHTLPEGTKFAPNFQFFSRSDKDARLVITTYRQEAVLSSNPESADERTSNRRRKRYNVNSDLTFCNLNQIECCLSALEINFERDFNWTWVLKPKQIAFNYCSGECPLRWGKSTRHSQLLERFRARVKKNPAAAAEPCCVPNQYLSVTLAIFLNGVHRIDLLEDIIATSCACR